MGFGMDNKPDKPMLLAAHQAHPRLFDSLRYVYVVLSRRSQGLSLGINTNPDQQCPFDCVYCQVDRQNPPHYREFDLKGAEEELQTLLEWIRSGKIKGYAEFADVPEHLLVLKDIALSGDGEPTMVRHFSSIVAMVERVKPPEIKIVLITNAMGLGREDVQKGLALMDRCGGEIWAKLDAGTDAYFQKVNRSSVALERIIDHIVIVAKVRPIVIQTLFSRLEGEPPSCEEIAAYCQRLTDIQDRGGQIRRVQITTLARRSRALIHGMPADQRVTAIPAQELRSIADYVAKSTHLPVECYPGSA